MCSESVSLDDSDQESALIPSGPPLPSGPSTPQEGMYFLHYAEQVMLAPTRSPSFTPGSSDLYYSPPPLPYTSPEMLPPVVSLSPSVENHYPGDGSSQHPWPSPDSPPPILSHLYWLFTAPQPKRDYMEPIPLVSRCLYPISHFMWCMLYSLSVSSWKFLNEIHNPLPEINCPINRQVN